jgi:hypothetical protein
MPTGMAYCNAMEGLKKAKFSSSDAANAPDICCFSYLSASSEQQSNLQDQAGGI